VVLLSPVILSKVFCALDINAVSRKRRVRRVFIELVYKPKAAFWALKMEVMSADDKATE
jgi:hypothetical protein